MTEYSGNTCYHTDKAVTGRLLRLESALSSVGGCAKILIWDGVSELCDSVLDGAVGLLLCGCPNATLQKQARRIAELCRLPSMEINGSLPENTIAILDTRHKKLFINPDLETIGAYLNPHTQRQRNKTSLVLEGNDASLPYEFEGVMVDTYMGVNSDEQQVYEYLCDISDRYTGIPIFAVADCSLGEQAFRARLRAIYRAGVWGRFSLICSSVTTPERAKSCIRAMHEAFHRLDSEEREFDGFMPKGLMIDTPLMLLSPPETRMLDLFCVDLKKLCRLFSGSDNQGEGEAQTVSLVKDFISASAPYDIILKNAEELSDRSLSSLLSTGRISGICVKKEKKDRFAGLL